MDRPANLDQGALPAMEAPRRDNERDNEANGLKQAQAVGCGARETQPEREELLLEAEAHAFYKTGRSSWLKRLKKSLFHRRNSLGPVVEAADFSFDFGLKKLAAKFPRDPVEDLEFSDSDIEEDLQRGVLRYGQDESSIRRWLNRTRREVLIKRIQLALVRITGRAQRSPRKSHTKK